VVVDGDVHGGAAVSERTRRLVLSAERLRLYSRRGNFHADREAARDLGLPGLVAQGMQVAGPAYGLLLDAWGDDWLEHGAWELAFVAMVTAGETVVARVDVGGDGAAVTVTGDDDERVRVVGRAWRRAEPGGY
jgi:acyl dehydratase